MEREIKANFTYEGYKCIVIKMEADPVLSLFQENFPLSYYCGYICVPYWHPAYEKKYDTIGIECHGGLTYSEHSLLGIPYPGWWIGFDCAHEIDAKHPKSVSFVINQCKCIVDQLRGMEG